MVRTTTWHSWRCGWTDADRRSAGVAHPGGDAVDRGQQGPFERRRVGRRPPPARWCRHLAVPIAQLAVLPQQGHLQVVQWLQVRVSDAQGAGELGLTGE